MWPPVLLLLLSFTSCLSKHQNPSPHVVIVGSPGSKTIEEVLEENALCKEENERLQDIIDDMLEDIAQLKMDVLHNNELIGSVSSTVAINTKHIQDNADVIINVSTTFEGDINELKENDLLTNQLVAENIAAIDTLEVAGKTLAMEIKSDISF